ncbi:hypothetical protein L484_003182 [Morus notabilis]|uniref:Uncharacterized protein n=1 Tax=Morus notabilis TaxID=981085 RepID=W9RL18_9ROSA|nr:hypothetical protein L484_003182 [Morus notabilis]
MKSDIFKGEKPLGTFQRQDILGEGKEWRRVRWNFADSRASQAVLIKNRREEEMGTAKFELEKFDGSRDFSLWRKK